MKDFEWTMRTENETENTAPQTEHYEVKGTDHGISYAPAAEQKTKGKKKSLKPIAALCAACVILSGVFGFGGAALANRMNTESAAESAPVTVETVKSTALSVKQVSSTAAVVDVPTSTSGEDLTYAQAAALVKDSVVEINTEYTTRNAWYQYTTGGAGSGVILSENGYIVTNAHVILDENMQNPADAVTVRLTNGEEYEAKVIAYDTDEDIAVLKIEAEVTVYERTEEAMNALSAKSASEEEQPSAGQKPEEDAGEWQIPDNWNDLFDMFGGSGENAGQPEQPQNGENPSSGFDFDFGQIPESLADLFGGR
ncbi:MAG: S1C family serine protease [Clostridiales bacterium]|nr:S1C family serine protease [Clostridiales bacterium]